MPGPGPDRGRDADATRESTTPYQGVPVPTRRGFLDAIAGLGGLALSLALVDQIRLGGIDADTPSPDTWPLRGYDPGATAGNLVARPPTDPEIDWRNDSLSASRTVPVRLVVGPDAVYAAGIGVVALDRADGTRQWGVDDPGGNLAVHDGTLAVETGARGAIRGFATDGTERWTTDVSGDVSSLVAADGTLFVGGTTGIYGVDVDSGSRRWADGDDWADQVFVTDGRLVTVNDVGIHSHRRRSVLDVPTGSPPSVAWRSSVGSLTVAATDGGLVAGCTPRRDGDPPLIAFDHAGTVRWRALEDATNDVFGAARLATTDDHCVAALSLDGDRPDYAITSHRLGDGSRDWRQGVDRRVSDLAVVDGAVLVATRTADEATADATGAVRALALDDGRERWRVPVDPGCRSIAPVDGTVFAVTTDERVIAIR